MLGWRRRQPPRAQVSAVGPSLSDCGPLIVSHTSSQGSSRGEVRIAGITKEAVPGSSIAVSSLRTVHVIEDVISGNFQELYLDKSLPWLRPNLAFVWRDGTLFFETNEIGLKGEPIDPSRRLAVVWGDSVVFGIGHGWPCLLDKMVPGYQFLNGGIEGDPYTSVLDRAIELNRQREISLNLILLGWHGENSRLRADLLDALNNIPNAVLVTMPTALNSSIIDNDLSAYFAPGEVDEFAPEEGRVSFYFYGAFKYSVQLQKDVFRHITERNTIARETARDRNLPLIDLFRIFSTQGSSDFREHFFDVMHPRSTAYEELARSIAAELKQPLLLSRNNPLFGER